MLERAITDDRLNYQKEGYTYTDLSQPVTSLERSAANKIIEKLKGKPEDGIIVELRDDINRVIISYDIERNNFLFTHKGDTTDLSTHDNVVIKLFRDYNPANLKYCSQNDIEQYSYFEARNKKELYHELEHIKNPSFENKDIYVLNTNKDGFVHISPDGNGNFKLDANNVFSINNEHTFDSIVSMSHTDILHKLYNEYDRLDLTSNFLTQKEFNLYDATKNGTYDRTVLIEKVQLTQENVKGTHRNNDLAFNYGNNFKAVVSYEENKEYIVSHDDRDMKNGYHKSFENPEHAADYILSLNPTNVINFKEIHEKQTLIDRINLAKQPIDDIYEQQDKLLINYGYNYKANIIHVNGNFSLFPDTTDEKLFGVKQFDSPEKAAEYILSLKPTSTINYRSLIGQAREADLLKYLEMNGYGLEKANKHNFRLLENRSIFTTKNIFYDHTNPEIKGNTLDFLIKYEGKSFTNAVEILTSQKFISYQSSHDIVKNERNIKKENLDSMDMNLPTKNKTSVRVFAYLNNTRKIDKDIINDMMKSGLLYESDRHNCVFLGKDAEGKVRYTAERSTSPIAQFRKVSSSSDKNFGFFMEGESTKIHVFKDPIEALSHATISKLNGTNYKKDYRISLDGTEPTALIQYLKDKPYIDKVNLCLNNDDAGKKASKSITEMLEENAYKVTQDAPISKSYNDDLIKMSKKLEMVMG